MCFDGFSLDGENEVGFISDSFLQVSLSLLLVKDVAGHYPSCLGGT